jgi:hypothetical protein
MNTFLRLTILVVGLVSWTSARSEVPSVGNFLQKPSDVSLSFDVKTKGLEGRYITKIDVANLWYKDVDNNWVPTNEMYLTIYMQNQYPIVIDHISGFSPKLSALDLAGDGHQEVILQWETGHGLELRVYQVTQLHSEDSPLVMVPGPVIGSDIGEVSINSNSSMKGYLISTINSDGTPPSSRRIRSEYSYDNGKLILLNTQELH